MQYKSYRSGTIMAESVTRRTSSYGKEKKRKRRSRPLNKKATGQIPTVAAAGGDRNVIATRPDLLTFCRDICQTRRRLNEPEHLRPTAVTTVQVG
mmetsp:Transcript_22495/g.64697  ORF Transcript_22495/g.64697 Transcript_22495/m.64697 type:complete len:95 (+) Transcript_22495:590-874(+)